MKANPLVTLTYIGAGSVHAIYGKARLVTDALDEVPFKLACFDIEVTEVRDGMFYGARISVQPEYEKTYDKRAAEKLDTQVFSAMKKSLDPFSFLGFFLHTIFLLKRWVGDLRIAAVLRFVRSNGVDVARYLRNDSPDDRSHFFCKPVNAPAVLKLIPDFL